MNLVVERQRIASWQPGLRWMCSAMGAALIAALLMSTPAVAQGNETEDEPSAEDESPPPADDVPDPSTVDASTGAVEPVGDAIPSGDDESGDGPGPGRIEPEVPPTDVAVPSEPASLSVVVAVEPGPATVPPNERSYVAVVVGISAYANLPDAVELDFARSDAATVANALESEANFDKVFLLGDGEASRESIRDLLRTEVAQLVGPDDVFVFYFVGHGIGADLGLPTILAHDSTLANGQEDGFEMEQLARDLQTWTKAGSTLVVTDVVHRNQLDGIFFFGPAADAWPSLPAGWMVMSATQGTTPGKDGAFASRFAAGMSGKADKNYDSYVTAAELFTYLVDDMSDTTQIPMATGDYDGGMVLAEGVTPPEPDVVEAIPMTTVIIEDTPPELPPEPPPEPVVVYPDYSIRAAKFVWVDGAGQNVQCREKPVVACAPNCYVREFKAGPCQLSAIFDGVQMAGEVVVLGPGKYDCQRRGGELECSGP